VLLAQYAAPGHVISPAKAGAASDLCTAFVSVRDREIGGRFLLALEEAMLNNRKV